MNLLRFFTARHDEKKHVGVKMREVILMPERAEAALSGLLDVHVLADV